MYIMYYPVLSCPIQSYPVLSSPILSYPVRSCPIQSYPVQSCPILSYPVLSCPIQSFPVLSWPIQSYLVLSCPIVSYPILLCPILSILSYSVTCSIWQYPWLALFQAKATTTLLGFSRLHFLLEHYNILQTRPYTRILQGVPKNMEIQ